jgi:hypothetical protein
MLFSLSQTGKIRLIFDYYFFKSYLEKKEAKQKLEKTKEIFKEFFDKENLKIYKNYILIKI